MTQDEMPESLLPLGARPVRDQNADYNNLFCGGDCSPMNPCQECTTSLGEWLDIELNRRNAAKLLAWFRALNEVCINRIDDGVYLTSLLGPRTKEWFEAVSYELTVMIDKVLDLGIEHPAHYKPVGFPIQHLVEQFEQEGRIDKYQWDGGTLTRETGEDNGEDPQDPGTQQVE